MLAGFARRSKREPQLIRLLDTSKETNKLLVTRDAVIRAQAKSADRKDASILVDRSLSLKSTAVILFIFALLFGPCCLGQEVTVRVINAANGRPLPKQSVSVSFPYDEKYDKKIPAKYNATLNLETDASGEAHFTLPEPPPVHFSAQVRIDWSRWKCVCGIMGSTDDLLRAGIMRSVTTTDSNNSSGPFKAIPGEVLFVVRPLSLLERLLYPLMKE